jgi:hypothetical protein
LTSKQLTFNQWADWFLQRRSQPPFRSAGNHQQNVNALKFLRPVFGELALSEITAERVEDYRIARGLRDLVLATKVSFFIHRCDIFEKRDSRCGDMLDRLLLRRRIEFQQEFVPRDFGLPLRDRAVALAGAYGVIFPLLFRRAIRLENIVAIPEHPWATWSVPPRLHLGMLRACFHAYASEQHAEVTFGGEHHSSPINSAM